MKTTFRALLLVAIIAAHVWFLRYIRPGRQSAGGAAAAQNDVKLAANTNAVTVTAHMSVKKEPDVTKREETIPVPKETVHVAKEEDITQVLPDAEAKEDIKEPIPEEKRQDPAPHLSEVEPKRNAAENEPESHAGDITTEAEAQTQPNAAEPSNPAVIAKIGEVRSYQEHFDEMVREYHTRKAKYVPRLYLQYETPNLHRAALDFFGFHLIARPKGSKSFYFERMTDGAVVRRLGECPYAGWCLEALPGDGSYFSTSALREGISSKDLELFYKSSDARGEAYLRGVELKAIGDAGVDTMNVASVEGILCATGANQFSLEVTQIKKRQ